MSYQPIDKFRNMNHSSRLIYDREIIQKPHELTPSVDEFDFGYLYPGHYALQKIEVKNTGYLPLNREDIVVVGYSYNISHNAPLVLEPDNYFILEIEFHMPEFLGSGGGGFIINRTFTGGLYIDYGPATCFIKLNAKGELEL